MSLFRTEVQPADASQGQHLLLAHPALRLVLLAIGLLLLGLLLFTLYTPYSRRANVQGVLAPPDGAVKLFSPRDGVVSQLLVAEGSLVKEGQPLLRLRNERRLEFDLLHEVASQRAALGNNAANAQARGMVEQTRLAERDRALGQEVAQLQSLQALQLQRLTLAEQKRDAMRQVLGDGFISANGFREYEEAVLNQRQQLKELERQLGVRQAERLTLAQELASIRLQTQDEQSRLASNESDLRQKALQLAEQREWLLVAPSAGRVTALQAALGQPSQTDTPLLLIVPEQGPLQAELLVPSRAIGFVAPGQPVRLQIAAFPYQRFGLQQGVVQSVSQNVLSPQEVNLPIAVREPVYRVKVGLQRQYVTAYGRAQPLRAGMEVSADIVVDQRPVWQWLFEPLIAVRGRMFG